MTELVWFGISDTGKVRRSNQDRFSGSAESGLFIVADGIAGAPAGEAAAQHVIDSLSMRVRLLDVPVVDAQLAAVLADVSREIADRARGTDREGMGSTAVAALVGDDYVLVAHLGDSRAYMYSGGQLQQLTVDHTYAEDLISSGDISRARAEKVHGLYEVSRFAGMSGDAVPSVTQVRFSAADRLLLCTDGLTNMVDSDRIGAVLDSGASAEDTCQQLVLSAMEAGGRDNVTVVVIDRPAGTSAVVESSRSTNLAAGTAVAAVAVGAAVILGRIAWRRSRPESGRKGAIDE